jgi:F-type H+-transporting ATPase subunit epsilon
VTLRVELVVPEGEIWAGPAELVVAKTVDGDIGVLTNHAPMIGILAEGSLVQIRPDLQGEPDVFAAVSDGFFSIANNRVSILARQAQLGKNVDPGAAEAALNQALPQDGQGPGPEESTDVKYYRALLRAASGQPN